MRTIPNVLCGLLLATFALAWTPAAKAVDPPVDGPVETTVKAMLEKGMWAPPQQGGTKHAYTYASFKYGTPRKGNYRTDGTPANTDTTVYPVRLEVEITRTFTDGTVKKETKKQTYNFFKDGFSEWTYRFMSND